MKGIRKMNKKIGLVAIVIVCILTALHFHPKTENVQVATVETSNMGTDIFQRDQFVANTIAVLKEAHTNYKYYNCNEFVEAVIRRNNGSLRIGTSTSAGPGTWYNSTISIGDKVVNPIITVHKQTGTSWINAVGASNLKPGDIVVGWSGNSYSEGHMFIYLGKYDTVDALKSSLGLSDNHIFDNRTIGQYGSSYWYAEGNIGDSHSPAQDSSGKTIPMVKNYTWNYQEATGSTNMNYLKVYRVTYENSGSYQLNIAKKSTSDLNGNSIPGAGFKITQRLDEGSTTTYMHKVNGVVTRNTTAYSADNSDLFYTDNTNVDDVTGTVNIRDTSKYDYYTFSEVVAPKGYALRGSSTSPWILGMRVYKGSVSSAGNYCVKRVELEVNGNIVMTVSTGETRRLKEDLFTPGTSDNYAIMINISQDGSKINYYISDKPITGKYHLNIVKKDINDTIDTGDNKYTNALSGAKYSIKQYIDKGLDKPADKTVSVTTIAGGRTTPIYWENNNNNVEIKNVGESYDTYVVSETEAPRGYIKSNLQVAFKVYKKVNAAGNAYIIDGIQLANYSGSGNDKIAAPLDGSGSAWIKIDKNGNITTGDDYVVALEFNSTTITIMYKNTPLAGDYSMRIKKVNETADDVPIAGVKFKVNDSFTEPTSAATGITKVVENKQITVDNVDNEDLYEITEIDLGNNPGIVTLGEDFGIVVRKGVSADGTKYEATGAKFQYGSDYAENNGMSVSKKVQLQDGSEVNVTIEVVNGVVTVTVPNRESGTYRLYLAKKSTSKLTDGKYQDNLGDAYFDIVQYANSIAKNVSQLRATGGMAPIVTEAGANPGTVARIYEYADRQIHEDIEINNVNTIDYYKIQETIAPQGYDVNSEAYYLGIEKEFNSTTREYKIKDIGIYEISDSGRIIKDDALPTQTSSDGKIVTIYRQNLNDNNNFIVTLNKNTNTVTFIVGDNPLAGTYNFFLEKTNASGRKITTANATFDVYVYNRIGGNGTNVSLDRANLTLYDANDSVITPAMMQNLVTSNGENKSLEGIKISDDDLDKTYYFLIHEKTAPSPYTKIDYDVVVPVKYTREGSKYVATALTNGAFAIIGANANESGASGRYASLESVKDNTVGANVSQEGTTIKAKIPNTQSGQYNFTITKMDVSGRVIDDEITEFDISIFDDANFYRSDFTGSELETLTMLRDNGSGTLVETEVHNWDWKGVRTVTGVVSRLEGIVIKAEDIGKTYYFVVHETKAPDSYTEIDYDIVVPISFVERDQKYVAVKGEAFAVQNGQRKELEEVATEINGVEFTEQNDVTINVNVPNLHKLGTYDLRINKVDVSGRVIDDEVATFDIGVFRNENCTGSEVTLSKYVVDENGNLVKDENDNYVETEINPAELKNIDTVTGKIEKVLENVVIHSEDVTENRTYYFRIHEKVAPDAYTEIDYDVVVPISFREEDGKYIPVKGDAYAIQGGIIKSLESVGSEENGVVSTNQVDAAIIVNVPNTPITGEYLINLTKVNKSNNSPIANAEFDIVGSVAGVSRDGILTDANGNLNVTNGNITVVSNKKSNGNKTSKVGDRDTYRIVEKNVQSYLKLKNPLQVDVEKTEKDGSYVVSKIKLSELFTGNTKTLEVTENSRTITLNNVLLSDGVSKVDVTLSIDSNNAISVVVPNQELEGKFKVVLNKVENGTRRKLSGIPFTINNVQKTTDANGNIDVTEDDEESDGYVKITNATLAASTYVVQEMENANTTDYAIIESPITLKVNKGTNPAKTAYIVSSVDVTYTSTSGEHTTTVTSSETFNVKVKNQNKDVRCKLTISNSGEITLEAENIGKKGGYDLGITKLVIDEEGNTVALPGVTFDINEISADIITRATTQEEGAHSVAGTTERIYKDITKDTVNTTDVYVIDEVSASQDNVVKLKNNLKIEVTKGLNNAGTEYGIKSIKLSEVSKTNSNTVISGPVEVNPVAEGQGNILRLESAELENGDTTEILLVGGSNTSLTLTVTDKLAEGNFKVKVRKINSATGEAIPGISFTSSGRYLGMSINTISDHATTGSDGIAEFREKTVKAAGVYCYPITEDELPASLANDLIRITDFEFRVFVTPRLDTDTMTYVVDRDCVSLDVSQIATSDTTEIQAKIANNATLDVENNIVTLTMENQPTIDYAVKIKKFNTDGEVLKNAKFTVYEDDVAIIQNKSINDLINEGTITNTQDYYLVNRTGMLVGKTHTYKVYEISPEAGYENILEKAYITFDINIADDGTVTASNPSHMPRLDIGGTSRDAVAAAQKIAQYLRDINKTEIESEGNNTFTLNIPNPRARIPMNLKLLKHTTASEDNGITGAVFKTKKLVIANEQTATNVDEVIARLNVAGDNLDTITTDANNLIKEIDSEDEAVIGNSYYYMITEDQLPGNCTGLYEKAVVRIHANVDRTITASIVAARAFGSSTWITDSSLINSNLLSISNPEGNTAEVKWANKFDFEVDLYKKGFTGSVPKDGDGNTDWDRMRAIPGAHFTVKQIEGTTESYEINLNNDEMNDLECDHTEIMKHMDATTAKTYHFTFVENSSRPNYINIFDGVTVHVYVTTTNDGRIDESTSKTYYRIEGATAQQLRFLQDKIDLVVDGNTVELYMANEEKTINVDIRKVSTNTVGGASAPVADVTFGALKDRQTSLSATTDESGMANIDSNIPVGGRHLYQIEETSAPDGISILEQVEIDLELDLTNVNSIDDLTVNDASLTISARGATGARLINELDLNNTVTLTLEGSTFVVTVPNETQVYTYTMLKTDEGGVPISNINNSGATSFQVQRVIRKTSNNELISRTVVNNGELSNGHLIDYGSVIPNATYKYEIKETSSKDGYINILQGYELDITVTSDSNGLFNTVGSQDYTLVETGTEPTLYTEQEIRAGNYINFSVTGNNIVLNIMNPYAYKFKLSKYDKNGSYPVDKAVINAEKITAEHIQELHVASNNYQTETVKTLLKEIVDSDDVEKTINLRNASTVTSSVMEIRKNDGSMMPINGVAQVWRITEASVGAPYENVLEGKYLIVPTMYRGGQLNTIEHPIDIDGTLQNVDFYVCDAQGNDVTVDYLDVIDVDAVKNADDKEWTLAVSIKDPIKVKVSFNKVELASDDASEDDDFTPLSGATIDVVDQRSGNNYRIENGSTGTGVIEIEQGIGDFVAYVIRETATAPGHTNVLENKTIVLAVRTTPNDPASTTISVFDSTTGRNITGTELDNIMKYINIVKSEDTDGCPVVNMYIENPIEFNFRLDKINSAENPLPGTEIEVHSSKSGSHYIGGAANMSFTEHNIKPGDYITYIIKEHNTVPNSAYINKLSDPMYITVEFLNNGAPRVVNAMVLKRVDGGSPTPVSLSTIDEIEYEINDDDQDGIKTLHVIMENPIQIDINVQKRQYGEGATVIPNTKFTLTNEKGEVLQNQVTNSQGNISFDNVEILPGTYTYKVKETQTAGSRYENILEGKYAEVNFTVAENGAITINSRKIYNDNGTEVTTAIYDKIGKYVTANVDTSRPVNKLNIVVYNPVKINVDLFKLDMENNAIEDVEIEAKRFKFNSNTNDFVIDEFTDDDGYVQIDDGYVDPGVYKYVIKEIATAGNQYINILDGLELNVYVKVFPDGTVKLADKNGNAHNGSNQLLYYIVDGNGDVVEDIDVLDLINPKLHVNVDQSTAHVIVTLVNPIKYELDIIKKNIENEDIGNDSDGYTKFSVRRDGGSLILDNVDITTNVERIEENLIAGTHTYYITEDSTLPGYINILNNKFIKATISVNGKGQVQVTGYDIYEGSLSDIRNGVLIPRLGNTELYENVDVEAGDYNNDGIYTVRVKVVNPDITYKITLNKKIFGTEHINLAGAKFDVISDFSGSHTNLVTDSNGNIQSFTEKRVPAGYYNYYITETRVPGNQFVNPFEYGNTNLYVRVIVKVNEDGTIEIVDKQGNTSDGTYYIYRGSGLAQEIDFDNTVLDTFVSVGTSVNLDKTPVLNLFVSNPEHYNFEIVKKDKDTDERLDGVVFTLSVIDQNNNPVQLRDADTLQRITTTTLVTHEVNGVHGVISIPNILIEKAGQYTFVLHEISSSNAAPILYKSWATDVKIKVEIKVENGEYVISRTPTVVAGSQYVDAVNVSSSRAQIVQETVTNERIKGHYDLIIDKADSYTGEALNGAEFDITVEKDSSKPVYNLNELYRYTDDVESMDVIIPGHFVVNGEAIVEDIRIEQPETYTITLTETKAPDGYMLLDDPIKLSVTTSRSGSGDEEKYIIRSVELIGGDNHGLVELDYDDEYIKVSAKNEYFDLALRKSITSVAYPNGDEAKITEEETADRVPEVVADELLANEDTTAKYNHVKNHVRGYVGQEVIYTLRVYNEGEIDGYAEEITDHLPEGLKFVNDDFNAARGWRLDENDESLRTVKTTILSEGNTHNTGVYNAETNLIKAVDKETGEIDYKEIEIKCVIDNNVKAKTVLTNIAEISLSKAADRTAETVDRDSHTTPGATIPDTNEGMQAYKEDELTDDRDTYVPGQEDDDDFEKIIVEEFDLALRKYIIAVDGVEILNNDAEKGITYEREPVVNASALKDGSSTTATYTHPKDEAAVEVSTGDIVTYTIEIFNEGTVSGYARLIKDDIPEGLEFVAYEKGDQSINDIYRWKMLDENNNEVTDPKEAKYVVSDYLSKDNESEDGENLIGAYDPENMDRPNSKYVRINFKVVCKQDYPKLIKNEAQISDDTDESGKSVIDRDSTPDEWLGEDDEDVEYVWVTFMDLALRKFITGVTDGATGETQEVTSRIPQVDAKALIEETGTTAEYNHPKDPVLVHTTDTVIYTLRVYNEGSRDGYATQIKDDLPKGLEFLPDHEINKEYEWVLVDENDNPVKDISKAKYAVTDYLSKDNETDERQSLMKAFNKETMTEPEYKEVKIAFKVTEPTTSERILVNEAQISKQTDGKGKVRDDRDSTPNEWLGEDDEDYEQVKVLYFDLALRKWVTKAIVTENGKTTVTETGHHAEDDPEEVVKVDLKKSKVDSVVVKFEYQIRITNEGQIAGYADEVKDYIPDGLRFDPADNPTWVQVSDNEVVTDELKGTLLQPGDTAEVTIVLTWINSATNMGVKTNIAEISKDRNDYGTKDIDSTPGNKVPGEDDIDDAPVMLTIKTGTETIKYAITALAVLAILALGVSLVKDVQKKKE